MEIRLIGLSVYVAFCLTACPSAKKPNPVAAVPTAGALTPHLGSDGTSRTGGGQDGGGGEIEYSTAEQVIEALEAARRFLMTENSQRFLKETASSAANFAGVDPELIKEKGRAIGITKKIDYVKVQDALLKIMDPSSVENSKDKVPFKSVAEYLKLSPVRYERNDTSAKNCAKGSYNLYPDAYVDGFKYGAEVCFNVRKLTRIPKDGLKQHALALWLHELSHLNGISDEAVADDIEMFLLFGAQYENFRLLNNLASQVFFSSGKLFDAVMMLHKYHVRTDWLSDVKDKEDALKTAYGYSEYLGLINGRADAIKENLELLEGFQSRFIFLESYAETAAAISEFKKIFNVISIRAPGFNSKIPPEGASAEEIEAFKQRFDNLRLLAFCATLSARKITDTYNQGGAGPSMSSLEKAKTEMDSKQCETLNL